MACAFRFGGTNTSAGFQCDSSDEVFGGKSEPSSFFDDVLLEMCAALRRVVGYAGGHNQKPGGAHRHTESIRESSSVQDHPPHGTPRHTLRVRTSSAWDRRGGGGRGVREDDGGDAVVGEP